jgi:hypothetical protein
LTDEPNGLAPALLFYAGRNLHTLVCLVFFPGFPTLPDAKYNHYRSEV